MTARTDAIHMVMAFSAGVVFMCGVYFLAAWGERPQRRHWKDSR